MCFSLTNSATAWATLFPRQAHEGCSNIFREADVRGQGPLIGFAGILPEVDVDDRELGVHGLGHARAASNQILRGRVRADAHGDAFADGNRSSIFFFFAAVLFEALVHLLRDLAQCQFAQSDQIGLAEKISQRTPNAFLRIDIATPHAVLQRLRSQSRSSPLR